MESQATILPLVVYHSKHHRRRILHADQVLGDLGSLGERREVLDYLVLQSRQD
jgi:hypothetical protein